jgi:hypothetical protein
LVFPHYRNRLHGAFKREFRRECAIQRALDDVRREQAQAQDTAKVGLIDLLSLGEFGDGCVGATLKHAFPAICASDGLDQSAIDTHPRQGRDFCSARSQHELSTATLSKCHRDVNGQERAVSALAFEIGKSRDDRDEAKQVRLADNKAAADAAAVFRSSALMRGAS